MIKSPVSLNILKFDYRFTGRQLFITGNDLVCTKDRNQLQQRNNYNSLPQRNFNEIAQATDRNTAALSNFSIAWRIL